MTAAHFAAAHWRGLVIITGIVALMLVVAGARRPARAPVAPDGSWKVFAGLMAVAAAILAWAARHHPAATAPAPKPTPTPAPTITHIVTRATGPSHPLLSGWQIVAVVAVVAFVSLAAWFVYHIASWIGR